MKTTPMRKLQFLGILAAALVLTLGGCGKKDEPPKPTTAPTSTAPAPSAGVNVASVTLGNALGAQKKVVQSADSFNKGDTIYASVDTTGSGTTTLMAKWTYRANGQNVPVREDTQTVTATGPATSEFHVSKPDGWPAGDYKVEIFASGTPSGVRSFMVK